MSEPPRVPFVLAGAAWLTTPEGPRAATLEELRRGVAAASAASLFYHAEFHRLDGTGDDPPPDDWSAWVRGVVQDPETAERIAYAVQSAPPGAEPLRQRLLEALDSVPRATREQRAAPPGGAFAFLAARAVTVPAGLAADDPEQLAWALDAARRDVWFHHLVEEPWFAAGEAPLVRWLRDAGAEPLAVVLERESRRRAGMDAMRAAVRRHRRRGELARRVLDPLAPAGETRALARRLVRRIAGGEDA